MKSFLFLLTAVLTLHASVQAFDTLDSRDWSQHQLAYWIETEPLAISELEQRAVWTESEDGWIRRSKFSPSYWADTARQRLWLKIEIAETALANVERFWLEVHASGASSARLYAAKAGQFESIDFNAPGREASGGIPVKNIAFQIDRELAADVIYLLVESPIKFDMQIAFWPEKAFHTKSINSLIFFFTLYGLLIIMVLYNGIIGVYLKERTYLLYAVSILVATSYQFFSHGHLRYFIPQLDWDGVIRMMIITAMGTVFSLGQFMRKILALKRYTPNFDKFIEWYLNVVLASMVLALFLPAQIALLICMVLATPSTTTGLVIIAYAHYKKSPLAKKFLAAWIIYYLGATLWTSYWLGLAPLSPLVEQSFLLGMSIEAILLSIILAYRIQVLRNEKKELMASQSQLHVLSYVDALTSIGNRRAFDDDYDSRMSQESQFGLALLDIDHFKSFNDTWGHAEGDKVIKTLGELLSSHAQDRYQAYRIGGEEFALIFNESNQEDIGILLEMLRQQFSEKFFQVDDEVRVQCSLSAGYDRRLPGETASDLFKRVDEALYEAKRCGRNQIKAPRTNSTPAFGEMDPST